MHRRRIAALVMVTLLALAGCGHADDVRDSALTAGAANPSPTSSAPVPEDAEPALKRYYEQDVTWSSCEAYECASVQVPLDYAELDGEEVQLVLRKLAAQDPEKRRGTLFINPGGPGGSGVDYVSYFTSLVGDDILDAYDIVGWDPRGVGSSTPLDCANTAQLDAYVDTDLSPDDATEEQALIDASETLGERCVKLSGDLPSHMSTVEVAKDLDVLRAVVGDETLTYLGASYGTMIGATYAELFPERAGRLVLDGAMDPALDSQSLSLGQAEGFQTALRAYLESCVGDGDCALGDDVDGAQQRLSQLLDDIDAEPLPTGDDDRPLSQPLAFYGVAVTLYNESSWPLLSQGLSAALRGDGRVLLSLADQYLSRDSSDYLDNSMESFAAVSCLDSPSSMTLDEAREGLPDFEKASPVFGSSFAWSAASCSTWPIKPSGEPLVIDGDGAAPVVVIGTTRDPATPYRWAEAMAEQLESGVLVTRDGDGHTGYSMGNSCVDDAVDDFLITGTVPEDGLRC